MRHSSGVASDLLTEIRELTVITQEFEQRARSPDLFVRSVGTASSGEGLKSIHGENKSVAEERYSTIGQLKKSAAMILHVCPPARDTPLRSQRRRAAIDNVVKVIYPVTPFLVSKLEQPVGANNGRNRVLELVVEKLVSRPCVVVTRSCEASVSIPCAE